MDSIIGLIIIIDTLHATYKQILLSVKHYCFHLSEGSEYFFSAVSWFNTWKTWASWWKAQKLWKQQRKVWSCGFQRTFQIKRIYESLVFLAAKCSFAHAIRAKGRSSYRGDEGGDDSGLEKVNRTQANCTNTGALYKLVGGVRCRQNMARREQVSSVMLLRRRRQLTLRQRKESGWYLMTPASICSWQKRWARRKKVKKCWANRPCRFGGSARHMSLCSALSQGLPGGWWVNRLTSTILPSPMGQAVFAQQHGGIQEIEEIPSLPVVLGSTPHSPLPTPTPTALALVSMQRATLLI